MEVVEFAPQQKNLLDRFEEIGGCVDYVMLDCDPDEEVTVESVHRLAAIKGLEEVRRRWGTYPKVNAKEHGYTLDQVAHLRIDYDKATRIRGVRIPPEVFLGDHYDFERKGLLLRGISVQYRNQHFFYSDDEGKDTIIPLRIIEQPAEVGEKCVGGYGYAFSDPPYTLFDWKNNRLCSRLEVGELFEDVNKAVLGNIHDDSVIFEWSRGWSNYFDAGEEWWGAYLWTFANPNTHRIVMLGASTTD